MKKITEEGLEEYLGEAIKIDYRIGILKKLNGEYFIQRRGSIGTKYRIRDNTIISIPETKRGSTNFKPYIVHLTNSQDLSDKVLHDVTYIPFDGSEEVPVDENGQGLLFNIPRKGIVEYVSELEPDFDNESRSQLTEKFVVALSNFLVEQGPEFRTDIARNLKKKYPHYVNGATTNFLNIQIFNEFCKRYEIMEMSTSEALDIFKEHEIKKLEVNGIVNNISIEYKDPKFRRGGFGRTKIMYKSHTSELLRFYNKRVDIVDFTFRKTF